MALQGTGVSLSLRVQAPVSIAATSQPAAALGRAGGSITAFKMAEFGHEHAFVDVSRSGTGAAQGKVVRDGLNAGRWDRFCSMIKRFPGAGDFLALTAYRLLGTELVST